MKKTLFIQPFFGLLVLLSLSAQLQGEIVANQNLIKGVVIVEPAETSIVSPNVSEDLENQIHLPTGRHVIADLWKCENCDYTPDIEKVLREAAQKAGATVLNVYVHKFDPSGMTATVALAESHITFHTWPDDGGFVACDIFTCGTNALPEKGLEVLLEYFKPKISNVRVLGRGQAAESNAPLVNNS